MNSAHAADGDRASTTESSSPLPLFAYGTLRDERFVGHLLEREVSAEAATLLDFERVEIDGFGYPAVLAAEGGRVEGSLYRDLSADDYRRLDAYEGVEEGLYQRLKGRVLSRDSELPEPAYVYLVTERVVARWIRR